MSKTCPWRNFIEKSSGVMSRDREGEPIEPPLPIYQTGKYSSETRQQNARI
jgi:hypothetical protein